MKWIFRFFAIFVILEIMMVYHCFALKPAAPAIVSQLLSKHAFIKIDQTDLLIVFCEIPELIESNESQEKEADKSVKLLHCLIANSSNLFIEGLLYPLQFKNEDAKSASRPLFLVYHTWKVHC